MGNRRWWLGYALSLALIAGGHLSYGGYFAGLPRPDVSPTPMASSDPGDWLSDLRQQRPGPALPELSQPGLVWLCGYADGYQRVVRFDARRPRGQSLAQWFAELDWKGLDAVEVGLGVTFGEVLSNEGVVELGNWGLLFACPQGRLLLSPPELCRQGVGHFATYQKLEHQRGVLQVRKFSGPSWVLRRSDDFRPQPLVRGEVFVESATLDRGQIREATLRLGRFHQRRLAEGRGLLPYVYQVKEGKASEQDRVLVRTCLGSWSLASYAVWTGSLEDREASQRNLLAMVERFGHWRKDRLWMADGTVCQLGSQALLGLALLARPGADPWLDQCERALGLATLEFQEADGHFRTSLALSGAPEAKLIDPEDDVAQDYFPGEALGYLAVRITRDPDGPWREAYDRGLQYYSARFERRPHPAAVPWLAWAGVRRYRWDRHAPSRDLVFRVLDWQLQNLQPVEQVDRFLRGAPINPERKNYGAFALSSTVGAQLQGLVAGHRLAIELGDKAREQRYWQAILEHSRYLIQVQYREEDSLYWLQPELRSQALGGIRDLPWLHQVQVDSAAHALNAWVELLERQSGGRP